MTRTKEAPQLAPSYTVTEVARALGFTERWVYQLINEGHIAAARVGRQWRITGDEVARVQRDGIER